MERFENNKRKKPLELLRKDSDSMIVKMKGFEDVYGKKKVLDDLYKVKLIEKDFKRKANMDPELSSAAQYEEVEKMELLMPLVMPEILGGDIVTKKTSKYDDYINGVDGYSVIDLKNIFAFALDYTVTKDDNKKTIIKKLERVKKNISEGHFTTIEYFQFGDIKGKMENIPRLIFPLKDSEVRVLERAYMHKNFDNPDFIKISLKFFEYINLQFGIFSEYAYDLEQNELSQKYDDLLEILNSLKEKKDSQIKEKIGEKDFNETMTVVRRYVDNSLLDEVLGEMFRVN